MVVKYKIEEADKNKDQREKRTKTGMNERLSIAPSLPDGRQALARGRMCSDPEMLHQVILQLAIIMHYGKFGIIIDDILRRPEKDSLIGYLQHVDIIV